MSVESERGCGYRTVDSLYLVCNRKLVGCDRLPFNLEICPCCGNGIKFARSWTWINPVRLFDGNHEPLKDCLCEESPGVCPACRCEQVFAPKHNVRQDREAGLLWIGEKHYETPADFMKESASMGISRKIKHLPKSFKVGKTWVFLAHIKASITKEKVKDPLFPDEEGQYERCPGIFTIFRPQKVERIVLQSEYDTWNDQFSNLDLDKPGWKEYIDSIISKEDKANRLKSICWDTNRGIKLVPVPDDDEDHNPKGIGQN